MSGLPGDHRILFARRDVAEWGFLRDTFEAAFEHEGRRWPSLAAWAESRDVGLSERRDALRAQYAQHPEMRLALLATGRHELVDDSEPGATAPTFLAGALLMELREQLGRGVAMRAGQPGFLDELIAGLDWFSP